MDYTADQRQHQHDLIRGALLSHLRTAPESREALQSVASPAAIASAAA
jgi:hypothetical protein